LLACEDILESLRAGVKGYEAALGRRSEVFGRRRFGLTPVLPGILEKLRFRGALHATLDDGRFPSAPQTKTRWQGVDTGVIDSIAKPPLDAGKPETFLSFAQKLSESMDHDHVATLCLAHWPSHACSWYQDLKRCSRFTSALGMFITVEKYFADTYVPGNLDRFSADQYRSPFLRQDVIRKQSDPISSTVRRWQSRMARDAAEAISTLSCVAANRIPAAPVGDRSEEKTEMDRVGDAIAAFAQTLKRDTSASTGGYLVINPCSFVRRIGVDVSDLPVLPDENKPTYAVGIADDRKHVVVDVPPMGFAWLGAGSTVLRRTRNKPPLAADSRERDGVVWLRNEFIETSIDPITGTLQTFKDYVSRGNRLSQQLALRIPGERGRAGDTWRDPDELATYSVMAADEVRVVTSSLALGEVESRGRLLDNNGQILATFRQTYRLWRGSRVLQLDIELDPRTEPTSDPWNSYYACRFAWSDETASLFSSVNQTRQPVSQARLEAPLYVEVEAGEQRTTILTGGLPYHRRVGSRMLDSLLVVRGERARSFRIGVGLDLPFILPEAIGLLTPPLVRREDGPPPTPNNCWLFHVDARSVVATHWSAVVQDEKLVGIRARFLESAGRGVRAKLSAFRAFTAARQVNFLGETLSELPIAEGKVVLDLSGHEWIEFEARWS
jgi:alpha-mannosidase